MEETEDEFITLVQEIDLVAARTEMDTTRDTSAKRTAKKNLAILASSRDADTIQIAGANQTELMNHRDALASYMVTREDLENLESHILIFR